MAAEVFQMLTKARAQGAHTQKSLNADFESALYGDQRRIENVRDVLDCLSKARKKEMEKLFQAHGVQSQVVLTDFELQSTKEITKLTQMLSADYLQKHPSTTTPTDSIANYSLEQFQNQILAASGLLSNMVKCYRISCPSGELPMAHLKIEFWKAHIEKCHIHTGDTFVECFESTTQSLSARKTRIINVLRYLDDLAGEDVISHKQLIPLISESCKTLENVRGLAAVVLNAHTKFPFEFLRETLLDISHFSIFWKDCFADLCGNMNRFNYDNFADWMDEIAKCAVGFRSELPGNAETEFEKCVTDKVQDGNAQIRRHRKLKSVFGEYVVGIEQMPFDNDEDLLAIVHKILVVYPFPPKRYQFYAKHRCIVDEIQQP